MENVEKIKQIIMELKEINEDVHIESLESAIFQLENAVEVMQDNKTPSYIDILMQYTFFQVLKLIKIAYNHMWL